MNRGIGLLVVFFLFLFDTLYGLNLVDDKN